MLNRFIVVFCLLLVFVANSFASVIVDVEGKIQKYPDGSTLNISAAKNINLDYYGIKIFIPKGEKISIRFSEFDENNSVFCLGNKFRNIKIGDTTLSTDKSVAFVVTQNGKLKMEKGSVVIKDKNDNIAILDQGSSYKVEVSVVPSDSFIPVSVEKEETYEQIQKDIILSPSAPRN